MHRPYNFVQQTVTHVHVVQGRNSLHYAVHKSHNRMVHFLLQHNPDITATDNEVRGSVAHTE